MTRKKGSRTYSLELNLEAHKLIEDGLTQAEVTQPLGIRDPKRVKNWLWSYRCAGILGLKKPRRGRPAQREHTELHKEGLVKCNIGSSTKIEKNTKCRRWATSVGSHELPTTHGSSIGLNRTSIQNVCYWYGKPG